MVNEAASKTETVMAYIDGLKSIIRTCSSDDISLEDLKAVKDRLYDVYAEARDLYRKAGLSDY